MIEEVAADLFGWLGVATKSPGREAAPCSPAGERDIIPPAQR